MSVPTVNVDVLMSRLDQYVLDLEEEKQITQDAGKMSDDQDRAYHTGEAVAFTSAIHMIKAVLREFK